MVLQLYKHCIITDYCLEEVLQRYCQPTLQILDHRLHKNVSKIKELNTALAQTQDDGPESKNMGPNVAVVTIDVTKHDG